MPSDPIYSSTAFGIFFASLRDDVQRNVFTGNGPANAHYSPKIVGYLIRRILPFTPMLTRLMFAIRGDEAKWPHNQPVEKWHDIVKNVEIGIDGRLAISRYAQASLNNINGMSKLFQMYLRFSIVQSSCPTLSLIYEMISRWQHRSVELSNLICSVHNFNSFG